MWWAEVLYRHFVLNRRSCSIYTSATLSLPYRRVFERQSTGPRLVVKLEVVVVSKAQKRCVLVE